MKNLNAGEIAWLHNVCMHFLTDQERTQLKIQHKQEHDGRIRDRIKAILLYDEGWTPQKIAKVLLISDQAVRNHVEDYKASNKLKSESGGSEEKLSKEQANQLETHLRCKRKVHIFCDNAPYYRNKAVGQYLTTSKIVLHFLPPYSPNLNPIERLWKWMKERVIYNVYYRDFEDFKGAVLGFFAVLPTLTPDSILGQSFRRRVRDKFRPVGAPMTN